eukprot:Pgem_evm1s19491
MYFTTAFTTLAFALSRPVNANVAFQASQIEMINEALDEYVKQNSLGQQEGCAAADAVSLSPDCTTITATLGVGEYTQTDLEEVLGTNGLLRKVSLQKGYSAIFYTNANFTGQYLAFDETSSCYDSSIFKTNVRSLRVTQNFECNNVAGQLPQQDAVAEKEMAYQYHPLFGSQAIHDGKETGIMKEAMISVIETNSPKIKTPLIGTESQVLENEGSIYCFDENGKDIGFHCLMEPTAITPKNDALRKNRNANLCANEQNGDQVHCHASDTSDMYRYVIVDHLNRGYSGNLDCKCGSPAGYVSDCDITTKNNVPRYESGDNNCKTGMKDRSGADRWLVADWGKQYLTLEDKSQQAYYAVELGLNDGNRRRSVYEVVDFIEVNGACKRYTTAFNSKANVTTIMAKLVDDVY